VTISGVRKGLVDDGIVRPHLSTRPPSPTRKVLKTLRKLISKPELHSSSLGVVLREYDGHEFLECNGYGLPHANVIPLHCLLLLFCPPPTHRHLEGGSVQEFPACIIGKSCSRREGGQHKHVPRDKNDIIAIEQHTPGTHCTGLFHIDARSPTEEEISSTVNSFHHF
jgi:hypothetical protein